MQVIVLGISILDTFSYVSVRALHKVSALLLGSTLSSGGQVHGATTLEGSLLQILLLKNLGVVHKGGRGPNAGLGSALQAGGSGRQRVPGAQLRDIGLLLFFWGSVCVMHLEGKGEWLWFCVTHCTRINQRISRHMPSY